MMTLLAALAAGSPAPRPRAQRVRVEGPLRDLAGDLVRIAGTIRSAPPEPTWLVDQARYLDGTSTSAGCTPGAMKLAAAEDRRERRAARRQVELRTYDQGTSRRDFEVVHQSQVDVIDADDVESP